MRCSGLNRKYNKKLLIPGLILIMAALLVFNLGAVFASGDGDGHGAGVSKAARLHSSGAQSHIRRVLPDAEWGILCFPEHRRIV